MSRPDQSHFLAHFTKNGQNYHPDAEVENLSIDQMSALQRMINILQEKKISASTMNWTNEKAVCFTECPWSSLLRHAKRYSPYGIGFSKRLIYSRNGSPVIYANPIMYNAQTWNKAVRPFLTPFVPAYAPFDQIKQSPFNGRFVDYTHEREWRVAKDFPFQYKYVKFIVLDKVADLEKVPDEIVKQIGIEKFLFMDVYRKIEELWPTHLMD